MFRPLAKLVAVGVLLTLLFYGVFYLLTNERVYAGTLGRVSKNYERSGSWDDPVIERRSIPYRSIDEGGLTNWDGGMYSCIAQRLYVVEDGCHGVSRAAFLPMFPLLWRVTGANAWGISLIDRSLFIVGLALLSIWLLGPAHPRLTMIYALLISSPTTVIFMIPYTESLFMAGMVLAAWGILGKKRPLYMLGAVTMAMTRPASVFVLIAIVLADQWLNARSRALLSNLKAAILLGAPFVVGHLAARAFQAWSSGSWSSFQDALSYWEGGLRPIVGISDWSTEGFGMSVFAISFVCFPVLLIVTKCLMKGPRAGSAKPGIEVTDRQIIYVTSLLYILGITVFTLLTSGGNLHSFSRFILASPFFFVLVLSLLNNRYHLPLSAFIMFNASGLLAFLLVTLVEYGADRWSFPFMGLYLWIVTLALLFGSSKLASRAGMLLTALVVFVNTVWGTYLLNMYLSNAWVFT